MNQRLAGRLVGWGLLISLGALAVFGIMHYETKKDDLAGEQIAHTDCTVFEKYDRKVSRGRAANLNYFIDSSCGLFRADNKALSDTLDVGQVYDFSATVGNWANKPTILSASPAE